jgi:hypothetical protein
MFNLKQSDTSIKSLRAEWFSYARKRNSSGSNRRVKAADSGSYFQSNWCRQRLSIPNSRTRREWSWISKSNQREWRVHLVNNSWV